MVGGYKELTSIIWYIYNETLKKERELLEKSKKKERDRLERIRNIKKDSGSSDDKKLLKAKTPQRDPVDENLTIHKKYFVLPSSDTVFFQTLFIQKVKIIKVNNILDD